MFSKNLLKRDEPVRRCPRFKIGVETENFHPTILFRARRQSSAKAFKGIISEWNFHLERHSIPDFSLVSLSNRLLFKIISALRINCRAAKSFCGYPCLGGPEGLGDAGHSKARSAESAHGLEEKGR